MIEINNLTSVAIDKDFIKRVARKVLRGEKKKIPELSIAFVGEARIRELNKRYRKKNRPTDVLSFAGNGLYEIVICPSVVRQNAKKFGLSFKSELVRILIHGILHLLGYDHEKSKKEAAKMERRQEYYFLKVS